MESWYLHRKPVLMFKPEHYYTTGTPVLALPRRVAGVPETPFSA